MGLLSRTSPSGAPFPRKWLLDRSIHTLSMVRYVTPISSIIDGRCMAKVHISANDCFTDVDLQISNIQMSIHDLFQV